MLDDYEDMNPDCKEIIIHWDKVEKGKKASPQKTHYRIERISPEGKVETIEEIDTEDVLPFLTLMREIAFDMANSGKYGDYPTDDTFNDTVEEGFNCLGMTWAAQDGTKIEAVH